LNTDNVLPDTVGFYVKVSSEENKDVFEFYLDNNLVFNLSGYMDWTYKTFLLDTGRHSLRFSYIKDEMVSVGEDAVWIDHIVLPYYAEVEVGETKIKNKDNIVMFPNPTKNNVYITNIQPNSEVYVYNSNSELVYFSKQEKNNMRMDTNFLKDGIYYIIFAKNKNAYCKQKLIVIH